MSMVTPKYLAKWYVETGVKIETQSLDYLEMINKVLFARLMEKPAVEIHAQIQERS